jgi:anti-repressor protein
MRTQYKIQKFVFPLTNQETRIADLDGNPWWVVPDLCGVLGLTNPTEAIRGLDEDEKSTLRITEGGPEVNIISEPGLYSLVLRSRKPEAKAFRRWVTHEVLPQIRKTGAYGDPLQALSDPTVLRGLLNDYAGRVLELESTVAEQAPKVQALNRLEAADGTLCVTDAAKVLNIRPRQLTAYLQANRWVYRRAGTTTSPLIAYQDKLQAGLLEEATHTITKPDETEIIRVQVKITPKGLTRLAKAFESATSN